MTWGRPPACAGLSAPQACPSAAARSWPRHARPSKMQRSLKLHESGRIVPRHERTQDAGRRSHQSRDRPEQRVGNIVHRLIEIRMVEQVERLRPNRNGDMLLDPEIFHEREVHIEEARTAILV